MRATDWRDLTLIPIYSTRPGLWHAAAVLGLNRDTAYDAAANGTLPTIQVGTRRLVPVAKLREMLGETDDPAQTDVRRELADQLQALADALRRQPIAS